MKVTIDISEEALRAIVGVLDHAIATGEQNLADQRAGSAEFTTTPEQGQTTIDQLVAGRLALVRGFAEAKLGLRLRTSRVVLVEGRWQPVTADGITWCTDTVNADRAGYATRAGAEEALRTLRNNDR
ncbi:MAG TPA: hypothetical protein VF183_13470 [Acidimicrobiales bacterium]